MRTWKRIPPNLFVASATLAVLAACWFSLGNGLFSPGPLHATPRGAAPLGGVRSHAELAQRCGACHPRPFSRQEMGELCLECHRDVREQITAGQPLHGRFGRPGECRSCHTEHAGPRAAITDLSEFDHSTAAFALDGTHLTTRCAACHQNQIYKGTPTSCVACHAEPPVHAGRFGTDCAKCHSTTNWAATTLRDFDHGRTRFPLEGAHVKLQCAKCHADGKFRDTPTSCVACHAEPPVHAGRFGTDCAKCHSTRTWKDAEMDMAFHRFPVRHGGGPRRGECAVCHDAAPDYRTYSCYGCHEHEKEKMVRKHRRVPLAELGSCVTCHPTGREHEGQHKERKERQERKEHKERKERKEHEERDASASPSAPPVSAFDGDVLTSLELFAARLRDAPLSEMLAGPGHGCPALGPGGGVGHAAPETGDGGPFKSQ